MALTQLCIAASIVMSGLCINEIIMKRFIDISISCEVSSCCQSIFYINVFFFTGIFLKKYLYAVHIGYDSQ